MDHYGTAFEENRSANAKGARDVPRTFSEKPASPRRETDRSATVLGLVTLLRDLQRLAGRLGSYCVVYANRKGSRFLFSPRVKIGCRRSPSETDRPPEGDWPAP